MLMFFFKIMFQPSLLLYSMQHLVIIKMVTLHGDVPAYLLLGWSLFSQCTPTQIYYTIILLVFYSILWVWWSTVTVKIEDGTSSHGAGTSCAPLAQRQRNRHRNLLLVFPPEDLYQSSLWPLICGLLYYYVHFMRSVFLVSVFCPWIWLMVMDVWC